MYIANVTDYDMNTDSDNITLCNCTNNENNDTNIEIIIPLITIIPCGMSLICLISLMVYTLIEPLFNKKNNYKYNNIYTYHSYMNTRNYTHKSVE